MTNEQARQFVTESFIDAFEANQDGKLKEAAIDSFFHHDLEMYNHSVLRHYTLDQIKMSVLEVYKKYQNLTSELKDVIVEGNRIAFRVEQHAFFVPDEEYVNMDVMNLYTLVDGKVKNWRLWFTQDAETSKEK